MSKHVPTILVYRIGQLGDTLIALPAIEAIRSKYPEHRLVLLTDRHPEEAKYVSSWKVLGETGWFSDVIFYDVSQDRWAALGGYLALIVKLFRQKPGRIFNLSPFRSKLQSFRDKVFFKLVAPTSKYYARLTIHEVGHPTKPLPQLEPEWRRLLSIVDGAYASEFHLHIPAVHQEAALHKLRAQGIQFSRRLVAIGHGTKMPSKKWPLEYYVTLGHRILASFHDVDLVVLGGTEDAFEGNELCKEWGKRAHNFSGKLSIYESAAVLELCVTYIGNDTGTMHLAAMTGAPCIALFSARDYPGKWYPYGTDHTVLRRTVECEGCMLDICVHGNECMKKLGVDEVFNAVSRRLYITEHGCA